MLEQRRMNANKAVLFDLDGVLVDACDWHYEALNRALEDVAGTRINREEHITTFNGLTTLSKLNMLAEAGRLEREDMCKISPLKQQYTKETIKNNLCVDNTKVNLLKHLKSNGYKIACVTNSIRETATLMLTLCGIMDFIDLLVSNEDSLNNKPHPEPYIKAMVLLNCLPENCTIIEDSPKGLEAARLSGANVIEVKNSTEVTTENINL